MRQRALPSQVKVGMSYETNKNCEANFEGHQKSTEKTFAYKGSSKSFREFGEKQRVKEAN